MRVTRAFLDGLRRVLAAPAVLAGLYVMTLLLALPLAVALKGMLASHLGASLMADAAAEGFHHGWWEEFSAQATGLGTTFAPTVIGFAAVLQNVSDLVDNRPLATTVAGAAGAYVVLWAFLVGGVIDRFARNRPTRAGGFFTACGVYFFRFLRLGIVAGAIYYVLFAHVHGWIFDDLYERLARDVTIERRAFLLRVGGYAIFGALVGAVNLVVDYAKVRAVVEDRRSMLGALAAAVRFVRRRPIATVALYLLGGLAFVTVAAIYAIAAPGARAPLWLALAVGQLYVLARLGVKLLFYASATAFFQAELAHAEYTAQPPPVWPESPAAEAIVNAAPRG